MCGTDIEETRVALVVGTSFGPNDPRNSPNVSSTATSKFHRPWLDGTNWLASRIRRNGKSLPALPKHGSDAGGFPPFLVKFDVSSVISRNRELRMTSRSPSVGH